MAKLTPLTSHLKHYVQVNDVFLDSSSSSQNSQKLYMCIYVYLCIFCQPTPHFSSGNSHQVLVFTEILMSACLCQCEGVCVCVFVHEQMS